MKHIIYCCKWIDEHFPMQVQLCKSCSAIHEILADKAFTATDGLISQSFVVAFVHLIYMWIAFIWGFPVQLGLWNSVHLLWRYKLNEVCDIYKIVVREKEVMWQYHLSIVVNYYLWYFILFIVYHHYSLKLLNYS